MIYLSNLNLQVFFRCFHSIIQEVLHSRLVLCSACYCQKTSQRTWSERKAGEDNKHLISLWLLFCGWYASSEIFPRCHMWHVFPNSVFPSFCKWIRDKWKFCEFWSAVCWLKSRWNYDSCCWSGRNSSEHVGEMKRQRKIQHILNDSEDSKWAWSYKLMFNFHVFSLSQVLAKFFSRLLFLFSFE